MKQAAGSRSRNVVAIGGMDRLERRYVEEAGSLGIDLKVFTDPTTGFSSRIGNAEALVVFPGRVSHRAWNEAMAAVKSRNIRVLKCRSCGIRTFRNCLECLGKIGP